MRGEPRYPRRDQPPSSQSVGRTAGTGVHLVSDDDVRVRADERRRMLNELELERNQLIRNIETCRIRDIERPFIGAWSLKDIVGHVASWEAEFVLALREIRAGKHSPLREFDESQRDHWNQDHVERKRDLD